MNRRRFLGSAAGLAGGLLAGRVLASDGAGADPVPPLGPPPGTVRGAMLYRPLGATGESVSAIGMGGAHLGRIPSESEAVSLIRRAIDRGLTFLDNSWDYNGGKSEERMGKALRDGYRQKVFLMTKVDGRTKGSAAKQLDESLKRLGTDHLDLLQLHEIIRMEDPDRIFAGGGAWEAVQDAKKAGKVRFLGFTGHKDPSIHLRMFETAAAHGAHFDTVQMPLNVMDAHFRSFAHQVLPVARKAGTAVLGMKSMGDGVILGSKVVTPLECLRYALSLPASVVITGIDRPEILDQAFAAVKDFQPMARAEVAALLAKTAAPAARGNFELFKTSGHFDSTAKHPEWLG